MLHSLIQAHDLVRAHALRVPECWSLRPSLVSEASSSNPGLWAFLNLISCVGGPPFSHPEHPHGCVPRFSDRDQPKTAVCAWVHLPGRGP